MSDVRIAEEQFYSKYAWCLNPALTVRDLLRRFEDEIGQYPALDGWQRDESKANLYLFVCAIACTADDYFGFRRVNLTPLAARLPRLRLLVSAAQFLLDSLKSIFMVRDVMAWRLRRQWNNCVGQVCRMLVCDSQSERENFEKLQAAYPELARVPLP